MSAITVQACASCGEAYLDAPSARCLACGSGVLSVVEITTAGRVVASTTIRLAPPGVEVPYTLAYADFEPGARLLARADGEVEQGDEVRLEPVDDPVERFRYAREESR